MKYLILIFILTSCCKPAQAEDYSQLLMNTMVIADWAQTRDIADNPRIREGNGYLGDFPTTGEVNRYFVTLLITYNFIGEYCVDEKNKKYLYYAWSVDHGIFGVVHNINAGIKFKF